MPDQGVLTVSKSSTFSNNTAHGDGGVISAYQGDLTISEGNLHSA